MKKTVLFAILMWILLGVWAWAGPKSAYMIAGGDANQDNEIKTILEGFGHTVQIGLQYLTFDGSADLSGYDVVLFLLSANWSAGDMPAAGQTQLVNFVTSGRGLVTGEWVYWAWAIQSDLSILYPVLPGISVGAFNYATPITYMVNKYDRVLNNGVISPFTFNVTNYDGTESDIWPKKGAFSFYESDNYHSGLLGWTYERGNVLSFSTPIGPNELANANYRQLLNNAIIWAAGDGRAVSTVPLTWLLLDE